MQLMVEMQGLRLMHFTMWSEGVREIVSAETRTSSSSSVITR